MWALGFHKKMVLYGPLAELFGIGEDNKMYFLYGAHLGKSPSSFYEAFGRCLDNLLEGRD